MPSLSSAISWNAAWCSRTPARVTALRIARVSLIGSPLAVVVVNASVLATNAVVTTAALSARRRSVVLMVPPPGPTGRRALVGVKHRASGPTREV